MRRLVVIALCLIPVLARAQDQVPDEEKVSNDSPGRPFQMPPASTEIKEAFEDYDRFARRGAWERAFKALMTIPENQVGKFVDGEKGFIISVAAKRRAALASLSPEGRAVYRLFYDAEAKKLFEDASGPTEQRDLERVYSAFFLTSVGDDAADRLGDLYFEQGRFDRAADCWLAVLRERPDTDVSPALLSVKAALALARAGRPAELAQVRTELLQRYADETLKLAGLTGTASDLLQRLVSETGGTVASARGIARSPRAAGPDLSRPVEAAWQVRFAASVEAGMTAPELAQWQSNPLSASVPAVAVHHTTLFANLIGYVFAVDLETGKLLWRTEPLHRLKLSGMQNQFRMLDTDRYALAASDDFVWILARDPKDQNFFAPFRLTCRRAETGELAWQSADLSDYAGYDLVSPPILVGGTLYVVAKSGGNPQMGMMGHQGLPQQVVLAIQPHDGKILWKSEVGLYRQGMPGFFYYGQLPEVQPQLVYRSGTLYVDTHVGVLARLDADAGTVDWGYGYRTDAAQGGGRFMFWGPDGPTFEPTPSSSPPLAGVGEGTMLVKGARSDRLCALEPDRQKVLWERPLSKAARLLGSDDARVFLGGPELSALDLHTRDLLWSTPVPGGCRDQRVLVQPDGVWQLTSRGIFEIDPATGRVRRIFRGEDLGSAGGDLILTDRQLLSISNRTITAYPRQAGGAKLTRTSHE